MKYILRGLGVLFVVAAPLACSGSEHPGYAPPPPRGAGGNGNIGTGGGGGGGAGGTETDGGVIPNVMLADGYQPPFDVSGDGKYVFFVSIGDVVAGENPTGSEQLFMLEVGTGGLTQLTDFMDATASGLGSGMNDRGHGVGLRANEDGSRVWIKGSGDEPGMYEIQPRAAEPELVKILPVAIEGFTTSDDFSFTVIYDNLDGVMNTRRFDEENNQAPDFTGNLEMLSKVGVSRIVVSGDGEWIGFYSNDEVGGKPAGLFTIRTDGTELTDWQGVAGQVQRGTATVKISHTGSTIFIFADGQAVDEPFYLVDAETRDEKAVLAWALEVEHVFGGDRYLAWAAPMDGGDVRGAIATADVDDPGVIHKSRSNLGVVTALAASSDGSVLVAHSQQKVTHKGQLQVHKD